jgi:hypothetical protein
MCHSPEEPVNIDIRKLGFVELESIIPLRRSKAKKTESEEEAKKRESESEEKYIAEKITNLSAETIKRRYPQYVRRLSARREGIKLRDALAIAEGE